MQPSHYDLLGQRRDAPDARAPASRESNNLTRSASSARRLRSEDSWVEISSQPSSSSLSSAATDEIVTTGLRVQQDSSLRRRRVHTNAVNRIQLPPRSTSNPGSSQDEYEESESESDRVMSSSNEDLAARQSGVPLSSCLSTTSVADSNPSSQEDEDDDNATALGITSRSPAFTPQPNAFSHPPVSQLPNRSSSAPDSYFPVATSSSNRSSITQRPAHHTRQRSQHTPYNVIAPSHTADHDAALRASLSTLLSCAAAARGLPKHDHPRSSSMSTAAAANTNRIEPATLRMVPESALLGAELEQQPPPLPRRHPPTAAVRPTRTNSASSISAPSSPTTKSKRKASSSKDRNNSSNGRSTSNKKSRSSSSSAKTVGIEEMISPTLMTWLVSAGVVVMFSAISFSAGYAVGKEVGRAEAGMGCGREMGRGGGDGWGSSAGGFRRLRWGAASSASVR